MTYDHHDASDGETAVGGIKVTEVPTGAPYTSTQRTSGTGGVKSQGMFCTGCWLDFLNSLIIKEGPGYSQVGLPTQSTGLAKLVSQTPR